MHTVLDRLENAQVLPLWTCLLAGWQRSASIVDVCHKQARHYEGNVLSTPTRTRAQYMQSSSTVHWQHLQHLRLPPRQHPLRRRRVLLHPRGIPSLEWTIDRGHLRTSSYPCLSRPFTSFTANDLL